MQETRPSHVAVLVPSVRRAADFLRKFGFQIGPEERWDGEGTLEIYVEGAKANSLLLMEPVKPGAYQRALEKRGAGLHHLAIDVLDLMTFLEGLSGSGWLLHPTSVKTIQASQTAYLARPGFPGLIEVQQRQELLDRPLFVNGVSLKMDSELDRLLKSLGLESIARSSSANELIIGSHKIPITDLI